MPRYIDADALIEKLDCLFKETNVKKLDFMQIGYNHAVGDAIAVTRGQPTADVVERKMGKWIWDENGMDWGLGAWCCSECGMKPETWWESDKRYNPLRCAGGRFCGNCGAMMREGDE